MLAIAPVPTYSQNPPTNAIAYGQLTNLLLEFLQGHGGTPIYNWCLNFSMSDRIRQITSQIRLHRQLNGLTTKISGSKQLLQTHPYLSAVRFIDLLACVGLIGINP